jgi:signal transduction histidine kinase
MALALGTGNHSAEFRMVRADERVIWVRQDIVLTREHGRTVILGFWVDIDKRKFAQAERDEMELELRLGQRLEAVGQLAAGVAHEINTPIQFVGDTIRFLDDAYRDLSELLAAYEDAIEQGTVPADVAQRLEDAASEADIEYLRERIPAAFQRSFDGIDRVATIVQALRSFAHPPSADKAPTDLNAALRNTLTVARSEYKYVAEVEELFDDLPLVNADVGDLGQVFLNLIVNAAHAIEDSRDDGGPLGRITVSTHVDGEHVVVSVSDTGGGIPPEVADRVFEPFFTTKDVGRGTGQGLAIARTIVVDRHNGSLTFETAPGAGTTFHIRLPITGEAPPVPAQVLEAA